MQMMEEKARAVIQEFEEIEASLNSPDIYNDREKAKKLSQQRKSLENKVLVAKEFLKRIQQKEDAEKILNTENDEELCEMAKTELDEARNALPKAEEELRTALVPTDPNDNKNAIVEIRSGVGGDEAALFAEEIGRMILRWTEHNEFSSEIISETPNEGGGI